MQRGVGGPPGDGGTGICVGRVVRREAPRLASWQEGLAGEHGATERLRQTEHKQDGETMTGTKQVRDSGNKTETTRQRKKKKQRG